MTPEEVVEKIKELLNAAGYTDHLMAFIIPEHEEKKAALVTVVHMSRFNALHVLTELANKMPDIFSAVVISHLEKIKDIDPKTN